MIGLEKREVEVGHSHLLTHSFSFCFYFLLQMINCFTSQIVGTKIRWHVNERLPGPPPRFLLGAVHHLNAKTILQRTFSICLFSLFLISFILILV
jgi:hypothetical protein